MLDIKILRSDPDAVRTMLTARGGDATTVDQILDLDSRWRETVTERDRLRGERRARSKLIGRAKDPQDRQAMIAEVEGIKTAMQTAEQSERTLASERDAMVAALPNLLDARTPTGVGEHDNVVIETVGTPAAFDFEPKPHWELGTELGQMDFERGVKLAGSRFYVLRDDLARLQRGLIAWMLNFHQDGGYRELYLPFVCREEVLFGAGQLPKFRENI